MSLILGIVPFHAIVFVLSLLAVFFVREDGSAIGGKSFAWYSALILMILNSMGFLVVLWYLYSINASWDRCFDLIASEKVRHCFEGNTIVGLSLYVRILSLISVASHH